ncbi:zinc-ribbon domain-containing protein [Aliiroseovarius subalbicans]|uniref:zinc-ribbon domain-containing protein n=1 Tax=Aliiroseovarius subalbicans TaxID=2925840 RepID=UPI001F57F215|nr:zinc-ribbon domain-containing protein [Aliiroseovarius subalbicans]MCI2399542.1 zinc-ribbon domain-containing protein [Aliiroseovarius subalbicans]
MRLICPNCGAQYEVDDRVVPDAGRDVQCSNCGHAWFQKHPDYDADLADELGLDPPSEALEAQDDHQDHSPESDTDAGHEYDDDDPQHDVPQPEPRALDDGVRDILQEEASRELEQREHDREQLESQPDLGLDESDGEETRRRTVRERMARLRGLDDEDPEHDADPEARRDLLPDIEEINSTLDATGDDVGNLQPEVTLNDRRSGGFRRGFILMLAFAAVLALLYVYAPKISAAVPALDPVMTSYVQIVDKAREGLDGAMQTAIGVMQGVSEGGDATGN